jgi:hypothetical protein
VRKAPAEAYYHLAYACLLYLSQSGGGGGGGGAAAAAVGDGGGGGGGGGSGGCEHESECYRDVVSSFKEVLKRGLDSTTTTVYIYMYIYIYIDR